MNKHHRIPASENCLTTYFFILLSNRDSSFFFEFTTNTMNYILIASINQSLFFPNSTPKKQKNREMEYPSIDEKTVSISPYHTCTSSPGEPSFRAA